MGTCTSTRASVNEVNVQGRCSRRISVKGRSLRLVKNNVATPMSKYSV